MLAALALTACAVLLAARAYTNDLWFREVGQEDVFQRIATVKILLFAVAGSATALALTATLWVARASVPSPLPMSTTAAGALACVLAGVVAGTRAGHHWQSLLLWLDGTRFGVEDPIHHRDLGFFVFSLPFYEHVAAFLLGLVAACVVVAVATYRTGGAIQTQPLRVTRAARVHLSVLAGLALLVLAWRWHLDTYSIEVQARRPTFAGPHYTDVHVRIPALERLSEVAVLGAAALLASAALQLRGRDRVARRTTVAALATLALVALVGQVAAPWLVERLEVAPQGLAKERPFMRQAIGATRRGLGLTAVQVRPFRPARHATTAALLRHRGALQDVQLWNTSSLTRWMEQVDSLTPFYRPHEPTVDASRSAGRAALTVVGERELDITRVVHAGRRWINDRLAYTHGYGVARASATLTDGAGRPINDTTQPVRQPRIYFGRQPRGAAGWVVANTRRPEVDVPHAPDPGARSYHYSGDGGVALSGALRRLAFAVRMHSLALLVGRDTTTRSRLIMHRDVLDRLRTLAPFLTWDRHPSAVVAGGRIVFLADGYVTSGSYPGAQAIALGGRKVTYARAAVRATVDAFSGSIRLYVADPTDPIVRAWARAFPSLLRPGSAMPAALLDHLRYPRDLFAAQARLYQRFHLATTAAFSSQADVWSPPTGLSGSVSVAGSVRFDDDNNANAVRPSYRLAAPPGQHRPRLLRSTLYSPRRGQNLVATLDGWIDQRGRPRLASRSLPRERLTLGPAQMSRQVLLAPEVSDRIGVLNRETTDLGRSALEATALGVPRVAFLGRHVVQLQPVYVNADGDGIMRLLGVTAWVDGHVGIDRSATRAVRDALRPRPTVRLRPLDRRVVVGRPTLIAFRVADGQTETVQVTSTHGVELTRRFVLAGGRGALRWTPRIRGRVRIRVAVRGPGGATTAAGLAAVVRPAPRRHRHRHRHRHAHAHAHPRKQARAPRVIARRSPAQREPSAAAPPPTLTTPAPVAPPVTVTTPAPAPAPPSTAVPPTATAPPASGTAPAP